MSYSLPGLSFRLFGFPVTIQLDFLVIVLLLGFDRRPGVYLVEWLVVVALAILVHELGHAFAVRSFGIHPDIRLWGLGGLTVWGFSLPPRKSLVVSLAGPLIGVPIGLFAMVLVPWLPPTNEFLLVLVSDIRDVSLLWGVVNLLPIAGLDGGSIVEQLFAIAFGARGRTPGLVTVAIGSVVVAIGAVLIGQIYLALIIFLFGLMNPGPYLELRRAIGGIGGGRGGRSAPSRPWSSGSSGFAAVGRGGGTAASLAPVKAPAPVEERRRSPRVTPAVVVAAQVRRPFGELYAETFEAPEIDLDDFEERPEPLLADVTRMLARADDAGVAARLATEEDPLALLGIVARVLDERRVRPVLAAARGLDAGRRPVALLRLQAALHALGRFDDSIATCEALGQDGGGPSAVLEARSAARTGDKKRTRSALERALATGPIELSDAALGDIVRVGPDPKIAELLARIRRGVAS